jgi:hypothetical protein
VEAPDTQDARAGGRGRQDRHCRDCHTDPTNRSTHDPAPSSTFQLRKPIRAGNLDRAARRWYESRVATSAVALLAEVPLFAELEPAELELIVVAMHERTFAAGETVTVEGELADGFYVIASGEAQATVQGEPVSTMRTGDHFGEIALLMGAERTATIKATTQLDCYGIAPGEFRALVEGNPTIAWKLMGSMSDRLA